MCWHQYGQTTCQTKNSKEAACPAQSVLFQFQCSWPSKVTKDGKHYAKMEAICMPKESLEIQNHDASRIRKCHKDQLKRQRAQAGIDHQFWQQEATKTVGTQWEKTIISQNRGIKLQRNWCRRQKEQTARNHPWLNPLPVWSAVGPAHQE